MRTTEKKVQYIKTSKELPNSVRLELYILAKIFVNFGIKQIILESSQELQQGVVD